MPAPGAYVVQEYTNLQNTVVWQLWSDGTVIGGAGGVTTPGTLPVNSFTIGNGSSSITAIGNDDSVLPPDMHGWTGAKYLMVMPHLTTGQAGLGVEATSDDINGATSAISGVVEGTQTGNGTGGFAGPLVCGVQGWALLDQVGFTHGAAVGFLGGATCNGTANPDFLVGFLAWPMSKTGAGVPVKTAGFYARDISVAGSSLKAGFQSDNQSNGIGFNSDQTGASGFAFKASDTTSISQFGNVQLTAITKCNAETTAGNGVPYFRGVTAQKVESGADVNVLTVTPPAATGVYRISVVISVNTGNAAVLGWTASWKDGQAAAQAPVNLPATKIGSAAPALTNSVAGGDGLSGVWIIDTDNSGTNIVIKTTFSGTSVTYRVSATIERLS